MSKPAASIGTVGPIEVAVAKSQREIGSLREDWLVFRQRYGLLTPNADPDRFLATVHSLGEGVIPHVVLIRDQSGPRVMVLGRIVRRGVTCRFGYRGIRTPQLKCLDVVYGGLVSDGEPASTQAVVSYFAGLLARREVQHIMLNHLPVSHAAYNALMELGVRGPVEPHWVVKLIAGSFEKSIAHHSGDYRKKLRRSDRNLVKRFEGNVHVDVFATPQDVDRFLKLAQEVSAGTYKVALGSAVLDNDTWRELLNTEARNGRLRSYVLFGGDRPLAYQNGSIYGETYMCDGRGYRPEYRELSLGTVLFVRVMQDLCERGITMMDFGFGDAEHKRIWGTSFTEEATLHLYGRGLRAQVAHAMDVCAPTISKHVQKCVNSLGLLRPIRKGWRAVLGWRSAQQ